MPVPNRGVAKPSRLIGEKKPINYMRGIMKNIRVSEKTYIDLLALIVEMRRKGQNVRVGELTDTAVQEFCVKKMKEIKSC